jgi:hypothetical protein
VGASAASAHGGHGILVRVEPARRQIDSWNTAERNAAEWMRYWGYVGVSVTPSGADGGVDIRARGALAQVKWEARQVGRPHLQKLVGARGRSMSSELLFFSGAGYSEHAVAYADEMDIALYFYRLDGRMEARSRLARQLLRRRREEEAAAADASPSVPPSTWLPNPNLRHVQLTPPRGDGDGETASTSPVRPPQIPG